MRGAYVAGGERQRGGVGTLDRPDEDGGAVKVRCVANRCRPNGGAERRARHLDLKAKRRRMDGKLVAMLVQSLLVEKSIHKSTREILCVLLVGLDRMGGKF